MKHTNKFIKKLLGILFLSLLLTIPLKADDIRDFQIEGMSIGDSLLDYFSEEKIEKKKKKGLVYPNKDFYSATFGSSKYEIYKRVQFHLKTKDKKYIIYSIGGKMYYPNNINDCYLKMDGIVSEIKKDFEDAKIDNEGTAKHVYDKTGKSTTRSIYIDLRSGGSIVVVCTDWSDELEFVDNLTIAIDSKEFAYWLNNEAYE